MLIAEERPDFLYKYMSAFRAAQLIETLRLYMSPGAVLNDLYDFNIRGFWQEDEDTKYRIFAKRKRKPTHGTYPFTRHVATGFHTRLH